MACQYCYLGKETNIRNDSAKPLDMFANIIETMANKFSKDVRFWSALMLLRYGNKAKLEGIKTLEPILDKSDGYLLSSAIDDLLETRQQHAIDFALRILSNKTFQPNSNTNYFLQRLFMTGEKECLEYLLKQLDNDKKAGTCSGNWKDKKVQRQQVQGDLMAKIILEWRTDNFVYETLAPDEYRKNKLGESASA